MPKSPKFPGLCLHLASGQGVVRLGGKDVYCGQWGTPAAEAAYKRALSAWLAGQDATEAARPAPLPDAARTSVNGLLLGYLKSALSRKDLAVVKVACREFSGLFGRRPAASCGPLCITEFQRRLVRRGCIPRKPGRPRKRSRASTWPSSSRSCVRRSNGRPARNSCPYPCISPSRLQLACATAKLARRTKFCPSPIATSRPRSSTCPSRSPTWGGCSGCLGVGRASSCDCDRRRAGGRGQAAETRRLRAGAHAFAVVSAQAAGEPDRAADRDAERAAAVQPAVRAGLSAPRGLPAILGVSLAGLGRQVPSTSGAAG
jgi:hypothetical protein